MPPWDPVQEPQEAVLADVPESVPAIPLEILPVSETVGILPQNRFLPPDGHPHTADTV